MNQQVAPSAEDQFDEETSRQIEAVYLTPDVATQRDKVLAMLAPHAGEKALDIGCGPGLTTQALAQQIGTTGKVIGVDIAAPMLAIALKRCENLPQVSFSQCDILRMPYENGSFDIALATQVYEYVEAIDAALIELARVIRPGGRVLLVDTDWESSVWASSDDARMRRVIDTWNQHIPEPQLPRTLKQRMERAGFDKVKVDVIPLVNLAYDVHTYSIGMSKVIGGFAAGRNGLSVHDIEAWKADLKNQGEKGEYFFSLNRYVFSAVRT
jgi:SAM-dependent methyltransferase